MEDLIEKEIRAHGIQAEWTRGMRRELYRRVRLSGRESVLDAGCGAGMITAEMAGLTRGQVIGIDKDPAIIERAKQIKSEVEFRESDAAALPFSERSFDLVTCHWLLLWIPDPVAALAEFRRVLRPGGSVLIASEPDYGGMVTWPPEADRKDEVIAAIQERGGDPMIGRKLPSLLQAAALRGQVGTYQSGWETGGRTHGDSEVAWLSTILPAERVPAIESRSLVIHLPVFYAIAFEA